MIGSATIALIGLVIHLAMALFLFAIASAPGWERARLLAVTSTFAAIYSAINVASYTAWVTPHDHVILNAGNIAVGGLYAAAWLLYATADESGRVTSVPRPLRLVALAVGLFTVGVALSGHAIDGADIHHIIVPRLGLELLEPQATVLGNIATLTLLTVLGLALFLQVRRLRHEGQPILGVSLGFLLFGCTAVEEALVSSGVINFMYLADVGFIGVIAPISTQLLRRFLHDARQLRTLSATLSATVETRTAERDTAREALLEQERLATLGRIAAGVGHEINNPLQYLVTSLEEIRDVTGAPPTVAEPLAQALEGAARIRDVVHSLRSYAMPTGGTAGPVDVRQALMTALRIATPQLRPVAEVRTDLADTPPVLCEEGKLVQALLNPLVNAAQALQRQQRTGLGMVQVTSRLLADGRIEVAIQDDGPGIDPAVLSRLGEPYVTTRASQGGTGLGVFLSQGLIAAMGGTLDLGNAPGGGAVATIRLPVAVAIAGGPVATADATATATFISRTATTLPAAELTAAEAPMRVLLVDDEAPIVEILGRGLRRMGFTVFTASDGQEAMARLAAEPVDAIVCDLMMPMVSGIDVHAHIQATYPHLRDRFIAMSGGATSPEAEAFLARPDAHAMEKPVSVHTLAATIRHVVAAA